MQLNRIKTCAAIKRHGVLLAGRPLLLTIVFSGSLPLSEHTGLGYQHYFYPLLAELVVSAEVIVLLARNVVGWSMKSTL